MPDRGLCHPLPAHAAGLPVACARLPPASASRPARLHQPRPVSPGGPGETPPPRRWEARPPHPLTPTAAGRTATRPGHAETDTPGSPPPAPSTRTTPGRWADRPPRGHRAGLRQRPPLGRHQTVRRGHGHAQTAPASPPATHHPGEALRRHHAVLPPWRHALHTPVEQGTRPRRTSPPHGTDGPRRWSMRGSRAPHPRPSGSDARWRRATTDTPLQ